MIATQDLTTYLHFVCIRCRMGAREHRPLFGGAISLKNASIDQYHRMANLCIDGVTQSLRHQPELVAFKRNADIPSAGRPALQTPVQPCGLRRGAIEGQ